MYKKDGITYSTHLEEHIDYDLDKQLRKYRRHHTYSNIHVKPHGHYDDSSKN